MSEGTIVERLQAQRSVLVDVVHQIEAAIKTFGGTISPNGTVTVAKDGRSKAWASKSTREKQRIIAKRNATRQARRGARQTPVEATASF